MILILFLTGVFGQATTEASPQNFAAQASSQDFATDRILVKFKTGALAASRQTVNARQRGTVVREISRLGIQVVEVPAGTVAQKIRDYKGESSVEFAEPDYVVKAIGVPNDTYYANQWGMTKIQAPQAWDITTGNATVIIAILDTGVDQDHADLAGKIESNKNYTTSNTTDDLYGHGTHVAGIAAAITNNTLGVAGVGYNSRIMNVKVLSDNGSGSTSGVVNGIIWAADNGAKVINLSLGDTNYSQTMQDAIDYAWNRGVVIVAAAGNDGVSTPHYPAYYSNAIAVAATDNVDAKASFSTYGSWVDVAAPGVNIFSTLPNHPNSIGLNYDYLSGTSMAAPYVAGLAGLLWATSYGTSNTNVRNRIESTADNISGTGTNWQFGRINAYNAVRGSLTPLVTTDNATNITTTGARLNGNLSYLGGAASANVSFQWGLSSGNYSANTTAVSANATGAFSANITGLSSDTTYYFRARAVGQDTGYGIEKSFTTFGVLTSDADNITASSARLRGVLVSLGSSASANVSFQWGTGSGNYSANTTAVSVNTTGAFSANITGLSSDTTYYFRARADGGAYGIAYGTEKSFMPLSITTGNADNITTSAARLNGNLTSLGSATSANVSFQWGLSSGNYSANTTAVSVNTTGAFSANITGLSSNTTYYFRARADGGAYGITYGAEKSFMPLSVTTGNADNITTNSTQLNGVLTSLGSAASVNVSFQWGLSSGNYSANTTAVSVNTTGAFSANITGLSSNTTYYFRARADGGAYGIAYGTEKSFMPLSITTSNADNITTSAARLNGNLTSLGSAASANVSFQWGLSSDNYSANTTAVSVNTTDAFSANITGLSSDTTYYFRAKAVTDNTTYGTEKSFTTLSIIPLVTTDNATNITTTGARLNGNLTYLGGATSANVSFQWGLSSGNYTDNTSAVSVNVIGAFSENITALTPVTTYYFRAKAGTDNTTYGIEKSFITLSIIPLLITDNATNITTTAARLNGNLTYLGGSASANVSFQWGLSSGNYSANTSAVSVNATGVFSENITALTPVTTYYFRAKAVTDNTTYGIEKSFTTLSIAPSVTTDGSSSVTTNSATLSGSLTSMGTATTVNASFEYGTTTAYGSSTTTQAISSPGTFIANITGLVAGTQYHFRTKADGGTSGVSYGIDMTFTTSSAGGGGGGGGGGGSGGGGSSARVDLTDFTSSGVITLNSSGATTTSYIIESADKNCTIQIAGGTKLVDASGIPLTSLTHGIPATVPDAPANVGVLSAQELGPSGARFDPAINLTLTYDQTKLSSGINEETPYIAFWDGTNWTALPTVLDTTLSEATASITHFTIFAVMVPTPVVTLPITPPTPVETLPMIPSAPVVTPPIAPSAPVEIPLITPPTPVAPIPSITPSTQVEPTPPTALTAPTLPTAPAATLTPTLAPIVAAKGGFQWWWGVSGAIGLVIIGIGFVIRRRSRATLSRPGQSLKKQ